MDDNSIDSIQIGSLCIKPVASSAAASNKLEPLDDQLSPELKQALTRKTCDTDKDRFTRLFAIIERSRHIAKQANQPKSFVLTLDLNISDHHPQWNLFFSHQTFPNTFDEFERLDLPTIPEYVKRIYSILKLVFREQEQVKDLDRTTYQWSTKSRQFVKSNSSPLKDNLQTFCTKLYRL